MSASCLSTFPIADSDSVFTLNCIPSFKIKIYLAVGSPLPPVLSSVRVTALNAKDACLYGRLAGPDGIGVFLDNIRSVSYVASIG